jgi:hypothetical protein
VNCQRGLIQIALELKSGGLDELLVIRIVRYSRQFAGEVSATHPSQVHIDEPIRTGKQARWFGWGMFAQYDGQGNRRCNQQDGQDDGKASAYSHVSAAAPARNPTHDAELPRIRS